MLSFRLFGIVEVIRDGVAVELGAPKQRAVLAFLLLNAGQVVSTDRLIEAVWGEDHPPANAMAGLHVYISRLRALLRDDASAASPIVRRPPGYLIDVDPACVDLALFRSGCDRAQAAIDAAEWSTAVDAAEQALAWCRGPLIVEHADEQWVRVAAAGVEERRATCQQNLVVGLLGCGRAAAALTVSQEVYAAQPLNERACWLRMITLYRNGRTDRGLEIFRDHAARLDEELALQPGPALRDLQGAMLRQAPDLDVWPATGPEPGPPGVVAPHAAVAEPAGPAVVPGALLVGRRRELAAIEEALREARAGHARWLVLTGEAGIGKSRLAEEAAIRWSAGGGQVSRTGCPDDGGVPALWPIRQLLRDLGADPESALAPPPDIEVDQARFAVYERVMALLAELVARTPLLVLIDDVHWADRASLRFLTHLAEARLPAGLVVVVTVRDGVGGPDVARLLAATTRRSGTRLLPVPPLSSAEGAELAGAVSGEAFDPDEAASIVTRTGGNPFFISEYARLPADERAMGTAPTAVRSVLRLRLEALDPAVLQLVRTAAIIGDLLDVDLLAEVTGLDRDTLADLLDDAADEHVIVPTPGSGSYTFAHALMRDELVASVSAMRRRRLHARIAEAIGPAATGDRLARRATHLVAALPYAEPLEAFDACRAAALDAEGRWHSDSAAHWWAEALRAHDMTASGAGPDRDEVLIAQVAALARAGRGQTVLDVLDAALIESVRAGHLGSAGRLAATLLRTCGAWPWAVYGSDPGPLLARLAGLEPLVRDDPGAHVRILATLAVGSCYDPDTTVPDTLSSRAIAIADELGDPDVLADALLGRAIAFAGIAERAEESIALLDRLLALPHRLAEIDEVLRHSLLTMATLTLGDTDATMDHLRLGAVGSDVLRLPVLRVQLRWIEGVLSHWAGDDLAHAESLYQQAWDLHLQTELYASDVHDLAVLSLRWDQGRLHEMADLGAENPLVKTWAAAVVAAARNDPAADVLLAGEIAKIEPVVWTTHGRLTLLAHAVADLGLRRHVAVLRRRLEPLAHCIATVGQVGIAGPVALVLARLAVLDGDLTGAAGHLRQATAISRWARSQGSLLRCTVLAAQVAELTGEDVDVAGLRSAAAAAAARGMTGVAREAADLLRRLTP